MSATGMSQEEDRQTLNKSNVFEKIGTDTDGSKRSNRAASAPAFTARVLERSTQPENSSVTEDVPLVDVLAVAPPWSVSASFPEASRSRKTFAFAKPSSALMPNCTCAVRSACYNTWI